VNVLIYPVQQGNAAIKRMHKLVVYIMAASAARLRNREALSRMTILASPYIILAAKIQPIR
jgi:hypothetical protein